MRHRKKGRKLNRNSSHRYSMFYNMAISFIKQEKIKTSLFKAKEFRKIIEPLITKAKINNISNQRFIYSKIKNKKIIFKLFNKLAPKFINQDGGYIRILKCGFRTGDKSPMAIVFLKNLK